jgi:hypothetical protein
MRKGVGQLVGVAGHMVVDARGFQTDVSLPAPAGVGQELVEFLNSARLAIDHMAVRLPVEPVGPGAKWETIETITQDGISVREKTYYQLVALEGPRVLVRTQSVQSAEKQRAVPPGLPEGVTAEVVSLRGSAAGEIELDLRRLVPESAHEEIAVDISFVIRQGQTEREMSLRGDSGVEIEAL